jgi:uncharacterized membrane protein YeaQ/YmgE (transglycosylase-associated protein family)
MCAAEPTGARSGANLTQACGRTQRAAGPGHKEIAMSVGTWVVIGLVAGLLASKFLIRTGDGLLRDIALGVGGAVAGGFLFRLLVSAETTAVSFPGILMTLAGAAAALVVYHRYVLRVPEPKRVRRAGAK